MSKSVLQHIVLPSGIFDDARLLYAKSGKYRYPMILEIGEMLDFRAFFNFFPSKKYREFAGIDEIMLELECEGEPEVTVYRYAAGESTSESFHYDGDIRIALGDEELIGFTVSAVKSKVILNAGCFYVEKEPVNDVHLAHIICTYRLEDQLKKKLDFIMNECARYPMLKERLRLYVIDNGNSFDYVGNNVIVIRSKNYGGSGGFSRGMIEALNDGISTHITLNDDDAMPEPESIYRTIMFHSFLSEDVKVIIGSVVFDRAHPYSIHDAGWYLHNGKTLKNRPGDVRTAEGCLSLERSAPVGNDKLYPSWCYMSASCETIREHGLSLPLFFQCDDTEYGLRTDKIQKVIMCGIAVWHPFDAGHSVGRSFYRVRNMLIALASNGLIDRSCMRNILYSIMVNVSGYRYNTAKAQLKAVKDFMRGPDKLFDTIEEGPQRFEEYVFEDPSDDNRKTDSRTIRHGRLFNIITLNGVLFPSIGDSETDMTADQSYIFYRKKRIYYKNKDGKEVVCTRSRKKTISLILSAAIYTMRIVVRKGHYNRLYSSKASHYYSEDRWREVFGIKRE